MTKPTPPEYVWEISGPFREHDSYILPHDDDTEWAQAREYAFDWFEEIMDQMDADGPKLGIEVQLRTATEYDLATLRGECNDD